ncbi:hypothetical protein [Chryseobacterium sp. StRB126]|uniref:hypothetical protein n=1 Tax=Chryseobacterium sp. StRB126 TaxID=878220 RepID=UPI001187423D|nr:hypothetical protein [Chryseobacterium sp. StRB126]
MNSFLKNIGLYDGFKVKVNISTSELIHRLGKITYKTNRSFISLEKDSTIPKRFEYRGIIKENSFIIKRRRHFFDFNINSPVLHGTISNENNQLSVSINLFPSVFQFFNCIVILCFFLIAIFVNIRDNQQDLMFLAIVSVISITQYFGLRRGISKGKYEFERELIYLAQKS